MKLLTRSLALFFIIIIAACTTQQTTIVNITENETVPPVQPVVQQANTLPPVAPVPSMPTANVVVEPTLTPTTQADVLPRETCTSPLSTEALEAVLPTSANGYDVSETDENTLTWSDPISGDSIEYSGASVVLSNDDGAIIVALMDTCGIEALRDPWTASVEQKDDAGYLKKITINGESAWTQFDKASDTYSITILSGDVLATVQGTPGVSENEVMTVARDIDLARV